MLYISIVGILRVAGFFFTTDPIISGTFSPAPSGYSVPAHLPTSLVTPAHLPPCFSTIFPICYCFNQLNVDQVCGAAINKSVLQGGCFDTVTGICPMLQQLSLHVKKRKNYKSSHCDK